MMVDTATVVLPIALDAQLYVDHDAPVLARAAGNRRIGVRRPGHPGRRKGACSPRLESTDQEIALARAREDVGQRRPAPGPAPRPGRIGLRRRGRFGGRAVRVGTGDAGPAQGAARLRPHPGGGALRRCHHPAAGAAPAPGVRRRLALPGDRAGTPAGIGAGAREWPRPRSPWATRRGDHRRRWRYGRRQGGPGLPGASTRGAAPGKSWPRSPPGPACVPGPPWSGPPRRRAAAGGGHSPRGGPGPELRGGAGERPRGHAPGPAGRRTAGRADRGGGRAAAG